MQNICIVDIIVSAICEMSIGGEKMRQNKKNVSPMSVVLSLEEYSKLTDGVGNVMDEADPAAESDSRRYTHNEVFEDLEGE